MQQRGNKTKQREVIRIDGKDIDLDATWQPRGIVSSVMTALVNITAMVPSSTSLLISVAGLLGLPTW
jgi:hypothetical protein